ncbi:MAG: phosphatase PAP2 family protein [Peptostreptococcaceae bacterium]
MSFWDIVFYSINGLAGKSTILDNIMLFSSKQLPIILGLGVVVLYIFGIVNKNKKAREVAVNTVIFTMLNMILSAIIGNIWYAPRPFVKDDTTAVLYPHKANSSFPSDHSLASMSIALGLNAYSRVLGIVSICLSILIGISRVYVGHHYAQHVLGSYIIAIVTSILYNKFLSRKIRNLYFNIEKRTPILKDMVKNKK